MFALVDRTPVGRVDKPSTVVRGIQTRLPWAWTGLCFGVAFREPTTEGYRDYVTNRPYSSALGPLWTRDGRGNTAGGFDVAVNGYLEYAMAPQYERPTSEVTVYMRVKRRGNGVAWGGYVCKVYHATNSPWLSWGIAEDGGSAGKEYGHIAVGGTPYDTPDTGVISTTEWTNHFLRWRSGEAPKLEVYSEAGPLATSATYGGTVSGTLSYGVSQPLRINSNETGANQIAYAYYSQCMVWSRKLADAEVASLVADPFGWYAPRRETLVVANPFPIAAVASSGSVQPGLRLQRIGHL